MSALIVYKSNFKNFASSPQIDMTLRHELDTFPKNCNGGFKLLLKTRIFNICDEVSDSEANLCS
jgi:hypothetical protein